MHVSRLSNNAWKLLIMRDHMQKLQEEVIADNSQKRLKEQEHKDVLYDKHTNAEKDIETEHASILYIDSGLELRSTFLDDTKHVMEQNHGHICVWTYLCIDISVYGRSC